MDNLDFTQIALAFGGLLVLLGLFYYGARALSGMGRFGKWRPGQRIGVIDSAPVDGTRRLVLIRRDDTEHLLLLGRDGDLVIESGIAATADEAPEAETPSWPTLRVPGRNQNA